MVRANLEPGAAGVTYIAFEGVEGSGKSTIIQHVAAKLRESGWEVVEVREPGGTTVAEAIRRVVLGEHDMSDWAEALLFAAQRSDLAEQVIRPALARGAVVLGDRSVYSSLAYQGIVRGLGVDAVRAVNEAGLAGTWPHQVVLLDVDPGRGLERQSDPDRIGGTGLEFQEQVATAYESLAEAEPDRFLVIDAAGTVDEITDEIAARIAAGRGEAS